MKFSLTTVLAVAVLMVPTTQTMAQSQPKQMMSQQQGRQTRLGPNVPAGQQVSIDRINHSAFNGLLAKYVNTAGGVNYAGLKASATDSQVLEDYIKQLSYASLSQPAARENQMAFWINAYNVVTLKGILQEYPTNSIRNFTSENGGYNIWKQLLLNVGGTQFSLEDIEHKVLRPMGDPRIHFAVVCASIGCPRLLNEAYVGERLNDQLNKNAVNFFSQAQNFQYDEAARQFKLSTILQWYGGDFGADQATQLRSIGPYLPTRAAQAAANANAASVTYLEYDWNLNEAKPMAPRAGSGTKMGNGSGARTPRAGSGNR